MNKLLPILVVIMLFIAGGTGYFAVSKYLDYKNNATLENVEVIEPVAMEKVSEIEIKEVTTNSTNKEPSNVVIKSNLTQLKYSIMPKGYLINIQIMEQRMFQKFMTI